MFNAILIAILAFQLGCPMVGWISVGNAVLHVICFFIQVLAGVLKAAVD